MICIRLLWPCLRTNQVDADLKFQNLFTTAVRGNKALQNYASGYLKAQDDGPDEAQGETVVAVHNVMRAHIFKMNLLLLEKLQRFVNILQAVDTHAAFGRPWLWETEGRNMVNDQVVVV